MAETGDIAAIASLRSFWSAGVEGDLDFEKRMAACLADEGGRRTTCHEARQLYRRAGFVVPDRTVGGYRLLVRPTHERDCIALPLDCSRSLLAATAATDENQRQSTTRSGSLTCVVFATTTPIVSVGCHYSADSFPQTLFVAAATAARIPTLAADIDVRRAGKLYDLVESQVPDLRILGVLIAASERRWRVTRDAAARMHADNMRVLPFHVPRAVRVRPPRGIERRSRCSSPTRWSPRRTGASRTTSSKSTSDDRAPGDAAGAPARDRRDGHQHFSRGQRIAGTKPDDDDRVLTVAEAARRDVSPSPPGTRLGVETAPVKRLRGDAAGELPAASGPA